MVNRAGNEYGVDAKERSGWLIPLAVFFVTACLSALVLAYYFAPGRGTLGQELPSPTDITRRVGLGIGAVRFRIPANYLPYASTRNGGARQEATLAAFLPDLNGFTLGVASEFEANAPDSRVIFLTLKSGRAPLPEEQRFARIYAPQVQDEYGQEGPYGLRAYEFRADSGYHNQDLFLAAAEAGPAALICDKPDVNTPSPNCLRDYALPNGLAITYRFKRARLSAWRQIDKDIRVLIAGFVDKG
jgi:hypothetical protein